jgi:hypothetical protein
MHYEDLNFRNSHFLRELRERLDSIYPQIELRVSYGHLEIHTSNISCTYDLGNMSQYHDINTQEVINDILRKEKKAKTNPCSEVP